MIKTVGIIDIGSNSVRLLLAEISDKNSFRIINELKEYVRLGDGLEENGMLSDSKIQLALDTLYSYKNICSSFGVTEITTVATEAVRRAKNQQDFLNRAKNELGLCISVLSGEEEAYYDYFSTMNSMNEKNALIMDIGGASTEFILVKNRELLHSISLPFGAITLTEHFKINNVLDTNQEEDLIEFISGYINNIDWLNEAKGFNLIGIGGSIRTLGKIERKAIDYPLNLIHNFSMKSQNVTAIYQDLKSKNAAQRKKIKGLPGDRSDIIVGAAAAVSLIINKLSIKNLIISRNGIREGLLFTHICKDNKPLEDVLQFSLNNVITNHNINLKHAERTYHMLCSLNQDLQQLYNQDSENLDNIIKTAAMLHDVGLNITYYFHNKHSLYIILNSQINGLTHRELVMSACIAANHRDDNSLINYADYELLIDKNDIEMIKKLGLLLKIAENIEKNMTGVVTDVKCNIDDNAVIIKTISSFHPGHEIKEALIPSQEFKKIFGKKLYIV